MGNSREELYSGSDKIHKEYMDLNFQRAMGKVDMRIEDLENHYRCVVNNRLNGKLAKLTGQMKVSGKYSKAQLSEFEELVSERDALLKNIKDKYEKCKLEVETFRGDIFRFKDLLTANEEMYDKLDKAQEKAYDDIYKVFDEWRKNLKDYSKELAKKSERLVQFLD